jgi:hypothetical protein
LQLQLQFGGIATTHIARISSMSQSESCGWMLCAESGMAKIVRALAARSGLIFVAQCTVCGGKPDQAGDKCGVIGPTLLLF